MAPSNAATDDAAGATSDGTTEYALFRVGSHTFGIEVGLIREIVDPLPLTPLPGSVPHVRGIVNLRGRVVTVLDLGLRFGTVAVTDASQYHIVLVEHGERMAGLAIDEIVHIVSVDSSSIDSSRHALERVGFSREDLLGAGDVDGSLFYVLNTGAVFNATFA